MLSVERVDLFYGASQALRGISLTAAKNAVTCVMGRNGVGKTSLMRAIVGQQPIRSGRIVWEDEDITRLPSHERAARGVAFVPQGREIFPLLSVEENLRTGFAALPRALRHVQDEIFELFPVLREMLARRGGDLSGGQQQQLAIADPAATRPRLLLLDEPTEGIQPSTIKEIGRVLRALLERNMTIVLVEQYLDFALELAEHCAVLSRGEIVLRGRIATLDPTQVRKHLSV